MKKVIKLDGIDTDKTLDEVVIDIVIGAIDQGVDLSGSDIKSALVASFERAKDYQSLMDAAADKSLKEIGEANPCYNVVCPQCKGDTGEDRRNFCMRPNNHSHDCRFNMKQNPPSSLNYDEYMPTHKEALDRLEVLGELKGERLSYQEQNTQYNKARSQEDRWNTEVKGLDFSMLQAAVEKATTEYIDGSVKYYNAKNLDDISVEVLARNICVEVEKAMGIFPNINCLY